MLGARERLGILGEERGRERKREKEGEEGVADTATHLLTRPLSLYSWSLASRLITSPAIPPAVGHVHTSCTMHYDYSAFSVYTCTEIHPQYILVNFCIYMYIHTQQNFISKHTCTLHVRSTAEKKKILFPFEKCLLYNLHCIH